jgi:Ca2+-binding RTX toxin-like protein
LTVVTGAVGALMLLPASAAFAGTYTLGADPAHAGNRLTYQDRSAGGEANDVRLYRDGGAIVLTDSAGVTRATDPTTGAPKGIACAAVDANTVRCPEFFRGQAIRYIVVNAGAGDDSVVNDTDIRSSLFGDRGNDHLVGGSAADVVNGDGGQDTLDGRGGDDVIDTDGYQPATGFAGEADTVSCGDGTDTARIDRKDTVDAVPPPYSVNFASHPASSCETVVFEGRTLGPKPPPGPPPPSGGGGSRPPVPPAPPGTKPPVPPPGGPKIPRGACKVLFVGDRFANRFIGNDTGDRMFGRGGDDVMYGFAGDDCLYGQGGNDWMDGGVGRDLIDGGPGNDRGFGGAGNDRLYGRGGSDRLDGGPGSDRINGGPGNDRLIGGPGNDLIYGGPGNDRIYAGPGRDVIHAGAGNDWIDSRDGRRDIVDCGPGRDTVRADRVDRLIGCERRR